MIKKVSNISTPHPPEYKEDAIHRDTKKVIPGPLPKILSNEKRNHALTCVHSPQFHYDARRECQHCDYWQKVPEKI